MSTRLKTVDNKIIFAYYTRNASPELNLYSIPFCMQNDAQGCKAVATVP